MEHGMNDFELKTVAPLPRLANEWVRKVKLNRTLNDEVESLHNRLCEDEGYIRLLDAVYDEQAVEGSLAADNTLAAMKIRDLGRKVNSVIADEKLATIGKALAVVLRRYGLSRKERRHTVNGQVVTNNNGD
jgi:hypothetical protein